MPPHPEVPPPAARGRAEPVPLALRELLGGALDYAGLFPPAALSMAQAVAAYTSYGREPHAWLLGRFVVGAGGLEAFDRAVASLEPRGDTGQPWRISVAGVDAFEAGRVLAAGRRLASHHGSWVVDAIELKAADERAVHAATGALGRTVAVAVEVPIGGDVDRMVDAIGRAGATVKVRTGGLTADAIPAAADLARVIAACAAAGVRLKATAGLHEPLRGERPLTYEPGAPRACAHGFVNLFVACALAMAAADAGARAEEVRAQASAVLEDTDPAAFAFDAAAASWRGHRADVRCLARTRRRLIASFGSCSFTEPVDGLRARGWLAPAGHS
jgi:hypothetical protein